MSEKTRKHLASVLSAALLVLAGVIFGWTWPVALIGMVVGGFLGSFLSCAIAELVGYVSYRRRIRRAMKEGRRLDGIIATLKDMD